MKVYNSENLPIERIRREGAGREFLHYKIKVQNSHAKPGNPNAKEYIDQFNDDEFGTANLDDYTIENIVKTVNRTGMPARVDIKFFLGYNREYNDPIKIFILPTCIDARKEDKDFYKFKINMQEYGSPEYIRELTKKDQEEGRYNLAEEETKTIEFVKEYIRRHLIAQYLRQKSNSLSSNDEIISYIEGLNIINRKYDLTKFKKSDIDIAGYHDFFDIKQDINNSYKDGFEAIERASIGMQRNNLSTPNYVILVYSPGTNIIGLEKGKTPEERARIAKLDRGVAEFTHYNSYLYEGFVEKYINSKNKPVPDPNQPGGPQ